MKKHLVAAVLFAGGLCAAAPSQAGVLYDDGAINGQFAGWTINFGYSVADTFNLSKNSDLTGIQNIGLWTTGDTPTSLDWAIVTSPTGGNTVASGVASLSLSSLGINQYGYSLYSASFALPNIHLGAGSYWLEFSNASSTNGGPDYWDMNGGPSRVWESLLGYDANPGANCPGTGECSDPFQVVGTAVPEPGTLALFGMALLALGGMGLRRKFV